MDLPPLISLLRSVFYSESNNYLEQRWQLSYVHVPQGAFPSRIETGRPQPNDVVVIRSRQYNSAKVLGTGSYAIVYEAQDRSGEKVAVKVLDVGTRGLFSNLGDAKRILREVLPLRICLYLHLKF